MNEAATEQELNDPYNNPFAYEFLNTPATANTGTAFHETDSVFADCFEGAFLQAEKLSIRLLAILHCISAPNCVYGEIMNIIDNAL